MTRNPKGTRRRKSPRLWSLEEAQAAVPYVAAVLRSLREHALEAGRQRQTRRRLSERPGRPSRSDLIALEEAARAEHKADVGVEADLDELDELGVRCPDPVQGQAQLPFLHDDLPALFHFDLFDDPPIRFWRFASDEPETRRPIQALQDEPSASAWLA
jgi:hypothetical protein